MQARWLKSAALSLAVAVAPAHAFVVQFDDLTDTVVTHVTEHDGTMHDFPGSGETATFTRTIDGLYDGTTLGVFIMDPDNSTISDLMTVQVTPDPTSTTTAIALTFQSDVDGVDLVVPADFPSNTVALIETGDYQVAYFSDENHCIIDDPFCTPLPPLAIEFRSDPVDVSEPSALSLLAAGLAAMGWRRRQRLG